MIFVQEFLTSGDPVEVEATFNALRDGMRACQGRSLLARRVPAQPSR